MDELRHCFKCGYETDQAVTKCPECGRGMLSIKQVRRLGWVQVFLGVFLVGFIAIIIFKIAPGMLEPGVPDASGSRWTGTREQGQMVLTLLGLIIVFGLTSFVNGVWQIATGTRSKWILYFGVGLFILLLAFVWAVENVFAVEAITHFLKRSADPPSSLDVREYYKRSAQLPQVTETRN